MVTHAVLAHVSGGASPDLVMGSFGQLALQIFPGLDDGGFSSTSYAASTANSSFEDLVVADVDRNGVDDVLFTADGRVGVYLNGIPQLADGGAPSPINLSGVIPSGAVFAPEGIAVGDINGDGNPDLVLGEAFSGQTPRVLVCLGFGDGGFAEGTTYPADSNVEPISTLAVADFNGDGFGDVVFASINGAYVELRDGKADGGLGSTLYTYGPSSYPIGDSVETLLVANLTSPDGGAPDLVSVSEYTDQQGDHRLHVLVPNGAGGLINNSPTCTYCGSIQSNLQSGALEDVDGDGYLDAIVATNNGYAPFGILINAGAGSGTFQGLSSFTNMREPGAVVVALPPTSSGAAQFVGISATPDAGTIHVFQKTGCP